MHRDELLFYSIGGKKKSQCNVNVWGWEECFTIGRLHYMVTQVQKLDTLLV